MLQNRLLWLDIKHKFYRLVYKKVLICYHEGIKLFSWGLLCPPFHGSRWQSFTSKIQNISKDFVMCMKIIWPKTNLWDPSLLPWRYLYSVIGIIVLCDHLFIHQFAPLEKAFIEYLRLLVSLQNKSHLFGLYKFHLIKLFPHFVLGGADRWSLNRLIVVIFSY